MKPVLALLRDYRTPLTFFFGSRLMLLLVGYVAARYLVVGELSWVRWDAHHYLAIAKDGYRFGGEAGNGNTIAFFPLYPLLVRGLSVVGHVSLVQASFILSWVCGALASCGIYYLAKEWKGEAAARQAALVFCWYPMSVFLGAPYAESLLLACLAFAWIALGKQRWGWSALAIGLGSVSKLFGVLMIPVLIYELCRRRVAPVRALAYGVLACVPFMLFMGYQYKTFGTPLAFSKAVELGWHKEFRLPWEGVADAWRMASAPGSHIIWQLSFAFILFVALTLYLARKELSSSQQLFGWLAWLVLVSTSLPDSLPRYGMVIFPLYWYWGFVLSTRPLAAQVAFAFLVSWMAVNGLVYLLSGWVV